jgi:hypothetical protein
VEYLAIPVILVFTLSLLPLLFYGYNAGRRRGYRVPGATVIVLMSWVAVFYCIYAFAPERISHSTNALYFTLYFFLMPAVLSTAFCALVARLLPARNPRQLGARKVRIPFRWIGRAISGLGILVGALALLALVPPPSFQAMLSFLLFGAFLWIIGRYVGYLEHRAEPLPPPLVEALEPSTPGPMGALYLRSFKQETQCFVIGPKEKYGAYAERWMTGMADSYGDVHLTFEQFFYATLTEAFGPFVALGSPEDYINPEGAMRIYAGDTDWKDRVNDLAGRAACIVVELGESQNLRWEFEHLRRQGLQKKLFVVTQPSHDDARFAWAFRGVIWRLKGIPSVSWREFAGDLSALGYNLDLEDPGPGSVIGFDENSRGILLTTQEELPADFVKPMIAWLRRGELAGRHIPTQCLSCGRSFSAAMWEDGKVRDRFCKSCDEGLNAAERFLKRHRVLLIAIPAVILLTLVPMAPDSWFEERRFWTYVAAIAVGSAIFVQLSNLYERRIGKSVAGKYHLLAESGDAIAMCYLGLFSKAGAKGVRKDDEQAVCWLRRAADAGDGMAMYHLGLYYHKGDAGLPQDGVQALNWYLKAANAGSTSAMNNVGYLYEYGACGVARDNSEARNWYEKAANLGNTLARENLELLQQRND